MHSQTPYLLVQMMPGITNKLIFGEFLLLGDNLETDNDSSCWLVKQKKRLPLLLDVISAIYCQNGFINISANLCQYTVKAGQVIICIPGTILTDISFSSDCRMIFFCLEKDNTLDNRIPVIISKMIGEIRQRPVVISIDECFRESYVEQYRFLRRCIADSSFTLREEAVTGTLQTMMSIVGSSHDRGTVSDVKTSRAEQLYRKFIIELSQNYRQRRDLGFYADRLCVTTKYLGQVVKVVSGRPPTDLVQDYVILDAKALLRSGTLSVSQIAEELHFANPSFFCKYFRRAVGVTPFKYEK